MADMYCLKDEHCPSQWTFSLSKLLTFSTCLLHGVTDLLCPELDGESSGGPPFLLDFLLEFSGLPHGF